MCGEMFAFFMVLFDLLKFSTIWVWLFYQPRKCILTESVKTSLYNYYCHIYTAAVAPMAVSATQNEGVITVTWTPPNPIPSAGYVVSYITTGDVGSVSVMNGNANQAVITGRRADRVYTISVVALSTQLPSDLITEPAIRPGMFLYVHNQ